MYAKNWLVEIPKKVVVVLSVEDGQGILSLNGDGVALYKWLAELGEMAQRKLEEEDL